jgi:hypothetical protein
MLKHKFLIHTISTVFIVLIAQFTFSQTPSIGLFSQGDMSCWEEQSFVSNTQYQLVEEQDQGQVLKAYSQSAASGIFCEVTIDLTETPYLNWSWKVDNIYSENDEHSRAGDDYPVRIFVVASGGIFFWNTKAVNYVWSSNQQVDSQWESAVTKNAMMLAVRSGDKVLGQWLNEKRNIREDFSAFFGVDITEIHAIAIMSDSDNTGQSATAYYGDIFFTAQ